MNCKGRRYLLNFCVGLLGGDGQGEWATFCTIVWWSNGGLKGKPPVDGQHVCLADAERSSSQPITNEYWGYVWLSLALITNYIRLYSWKWVKILLRPFWSHFTYPQSRILSPFSFWKTLMLCRTTSLQVIILDQILHITVSNIIIFCDQHIAYFANWRSGYFFFNKLENSRFG